jgi:hypothetical protein
MTLVHIHSHQCRFGGIDDQFFFHFFYELGNRQMVRLVNESDRAQLFGFRADFFIPQHAAPQESAQLPTLAPRVKQSLF